MLHSRISKLLLFSAAAVFLLFCGVYALADELPSVDIVSRPETLIEPAEITLSFTIENTTGNDCGNLYISTSDGLISEPLGSLAAGESLSFNRRHSVTEEELNDGSIAYIFSYDDPEEPDRKVNFTVETPIKRAESRVDCEFTRTFSSDSVPSGGTVTILYTVRNTGNTPVEGLRISDALGDFTGRIETLEVGENRSLVSRITLTEPAVSSAQLTYDAPEGSRTVTLEDKTIGISQAALECELKVERSSERADTAVGVLTLKNTGDSKLTRIKVTDDFTDRVIREGLSLAPSEARTVKYVFSLHDEGVRWRIMANVSDGTKIDTITETVYPETDNKTDLADITFTAEAVTPRLKRTGNATVRFVIRNNGSAPVRQLVISDSASDFSREIAVISAGGTVDREFNIPVNGSTEFNFTLDYTDEDGWQYTDECEPVSITIASDGVMPADASDSVIDFGSGSVHVNGGSMFAVLLIIGILLLIGLTVALIVLSHRERVRKQVRKALQKQNKGRT